jgi:hypothetical protein
MDSIATSIAPVEISGTLNLNLVLTMEAWIHQMIP